MSKVSAKILDKHTVEVDWQEKVNIGKRVNVQDIRVFIKNSNPAMAAGITQRGKASMDLQIKRGSVMSNDNKEALALGVNATPKGSDAKRYKSRLGSAARLSLLKESHVRFRMPPMQ